MWVKMYYVGYMYYVDCSHVKDNRDPKFYIECVMKSQSSNQLNKSKSTENKFS